jgi:hypothetical protein
LSRERIDGSRGAAPEVEPRWGEHVDVPAGRPPIPADHLTDPPNLILLRDLDATVTCEVASCARTNVAFEKHILPDQEALLRRARARSSLAYK